MRALFTIVFGLLLAGSAGIVDAQRNETCRSVRASLSVSAMKPVNPGHMLDVQYSISSNDSSRDNRWGTMQVEVDVVFRDGERRRTNLAAPRVEWGSFTIQCFVSGQNREIRSLRVIKTTCPASPSGHRCLAGVG
ncbi:MAG: hypothetical protein E2O56_06420 [Gammaproteobacteria bacterium]|nr:MAG: hypothetical protein E2O56_06420 [Gammaproteobacteria bacterium]